MRLCCHLEGSRSLIGHCIAIGSTIPRVLHMEITYKTNSHTTIAKSQHNLGIKLTDRIAK